MAIVACMGKVCRVQSLERGTVRQRAGLSRAWVGRLVRCTEGHVAAWEAGDVEDARLERVYGAVGGLLELAEDAVDAR